MVNLGYSFVDDESERKAGKTFTVENVKAEHQDMREEYAATHSSDSTELALWLNLCRVTDAIQHATTVNFEEINSEKATYKEVIPEAKSPPSSNYSSSFSYNPGKPFNKNLEDVLKNINSNTQWFNQKLNDLLNQSTCYGKCKK